MWSERQLVVPSCQLRSLEEDDDDDDDHITADNLEAERDIFAELRRGIYEHHLHVMTLGSGHTTLRDKFMSVVQTVFQEAGSSPTSMSSFF